MVQKGREVAKEKGRVEVEEKGRWCRKGGGAKGEVEKGGEEVVEELKMSRGGGGEWEVEVEYRRGEGEEVE